MRDDPRPEDPVTDSKTSADVRLDLLRALRLDTVGPEPGGPYADEELPQAPSRWYLTGFLVPYEAPADQRQDEQGNEQLARMRLLVVRTVEPVGAEFFVEPE